MKTKKSLLILTAIALAFALAFTACPVEPEPVHTHEWEWVVTTPATTTAEGLETETCKTCGEINRTRPIAKLLVEMVRVNGGTFKMGSLTGETDRQSNETQWDVTLSAFYIGKYEVTQAQYQAVMGTNPSNFRQTSQVGKFRTGVL